MSTTSTSTSCCICWDNCDAADHAVLTCCSGHCCHSCLKTWAVARVSWPEENKYTVPCPRCRSILDREVIEKWTDIRVCVVRSGPSLLARLRSVVRYALYDLLGEGMTQFSVFMTTTCCPRCSRRIYRDGGCENMTCANPCRASFKWVNKPLAMANLLFFAGTSYAMQNIKFSTTFSYPETYYFSFFGVFVLQTMSVLALASEGRIHSLPGPNAVLGFAMGALTLSAPYSVAMEADTWNPLTIGLRILWRFGHYAYCVFSAVVTQRTALALAIGAPLVLGFVTFMSILREKRIQQIRERNERVRQERAEARARTRAEAQAKAKAQAALSTEMMTSSRALRLERRALRAQQAAN